MNSRHRGSPLCAALALLVCALCVRRAVADPSPPEPGYGAAAANGGLAGDAGPEHTASSASAETPLEADAAVPEASAPPPSAPLATPDSAAPEIHAGAASSAPADAGTKPDTPAKSQPKPSLGTGIQPANAGQRAGMITVLAGSLTTFAGLYLWLDSDARTARVQTNCVKRSDTYWLCPESTHGDLNRARTENVVGMTGTAVGAVLISIGAYLWLHHEPPETTAFVGPNGVAIQGRF